MPVSKKILVVEDDPDLRLQLEYFLSKIGYQVVGAKNCEEALRVCMAHHPRAVLLDIMLPGTNGYEICSRIKGDPATRETVVVFLTAKKAGEVHLEGSRVGGDYWISKPVDPKDVGADMYLLFEKNMELSEEDKSQLRVLKPLPKYSQASTLHYPRSGEPIPKGVAEHHQSGPEVYHTANKPPEHHGHPVHGNHGDGALRESDIQNLYRLVVQLRESLDQTDEKLSAVVRFLKQHMPHN